MHGALSDTMFRGRTKELGAIRSALDRTDAEVIQVTGPRGVGKSALVERATEGCRRISHTAPPLPDPAQRSSLASTLDSALGEHPWTNPAPEWEEIFTRLVRAAATEQVPTVLVLDDAHRLLEARSRVAGPLTSARRRARDVGAPLHIVLVGGAGAMPGLLEEQGGTVDLTIELAPLPFRAAAPFLPGSSAAERMRSYAVFGGIPAHLRHVDPGASLATNIRRCFLDPDAPLAELGVGVLERSVQTPSRYAAVLSTLAAGETDWGRIHAGVPDLTASGQLAPYLKRLDELGLVEVRRSLDAGAASRGRRYRITDPLIAFWFRYALPFRYGASVRDAAGYLSETVRPALDAQVATIFPSICRQHMASSAREHLGANARELGSLWGSGYDIDVAGLLTSGAAFYGTPVWPGRPADVDALERLEAMIPATRYGFGRERRLRLVFSAGGFTTALERRAAKRDDLELVGPKTLAGTE